jgi:peroxiredoxin
MSDRALHDAGDVGFADDGLGDELALDELYGEEPSQDEEAAPSVVAGPTPPSVERVDDVEGVDALAEPQAEPYAAGKARADRPGLRERIRSSRVGTLVVLLVTGALVAGGLWLVNGRSPGGETLANGATAVTIPGKSTVPPPKVGSPAQDFTVTTIDGKQVSLSQFRGQPVWIVFGASWCSGCQAEVPDIEAAYKEYGPKGLVILGINITEDSNTVRDYAKRVGITNLMAADPESAVADAYRVSAIPAHFYVDKDGVLREIRQGAVSADTIATSMKGLVTP